MEDFVGIPFNEIQEISNPEIQHQMLINTSEGMRRIRWGILETNAQKPLANYALKTEIPDVSNFANREEVYTLKTRIEIVNGKFANYALKHEIPQDILSTVIERGNIATKDIEFPGKDIQSNNVRIGYNKETESYYFNSSPIGGKGGKYNIFIGGGSGSRNETGSYNTILGNGFLRSENGECNVISGFNAGFYLEGTKEQTSYNVIIGTNTAFRATKASSNVFIGHNVGGNISDGVRISNVENISPVAKEHLISNANLSGYNRTEQTCSSSLNTFIGNNIIFSGRSPSSAVMSTIIGASTLQGCRYTSVNNIVLGAGNYPSNRETHFNNSIVIGNCINLPNQTHSLHIGMDKDRRQNAEDVIIVGELPNNKLTFNAPVTIPSKHMRNAEGDSTYTKQLVANHNGDIGWKEVSVNNSKPLFEKTFKIVDGVYRPYTIFRIPEGVEKLDYYSVQNFNQGFDMEGLYIILPSTLKVIENICIQNPIVGIEFNEGLEEIKGYNFISNNSYPLNLMPNNTYLPNLKKIENRAFNRNSGQIFLGKTITLGESTIYYNESFGVSPYEILIRKGVFVVGD